MNSSDIEICSKCGREIPKSQQAYVFEVEIVCAECDRKLRISSEQKAVDLTGSEFFSRVPSSTSEGGEKEVDKDICEILGLSDIEVPATVDISKSLEKKGAVTKSNSDDIQVEVGVTETYSGYRDKTIVSKESLNTAGIERAEKAYRWVKRGLQYFAVMFVLLVIGGIVALLGLEIFAVALVMTSVLVGGILSVIGIGFVIAGVCMGFVATTIMRISGNNDSKRTAKKAMIIGAALLCVILLLGLVGVFTPREGQSVIHRFWGWIGLLIMLEWLTTSTWVGFEAKALMEGIPRAELRRISGGMDPGWWALLSTFCWVIGFPWYIMKRGEYIAFHLVTLEREKATQDQNTAI